MNKIQQNIFMVIILSIVSIFVVPWIATAFFYSIIQVNPPILDSEILRNIFSFTPVWHNLSTALRNQQRLFIGGIVVGVMGISITIIIAKLSREFPQLLYFLIIYLVGFGANFFDCVWLFRPDPHKAFIVAFVRSFVWFLVGIITFYALKNVFIVTEKDNLKKSL